MNGRPELFTSYAQELRLFNTRPKQVAVLAMLIFAILLPFGAPDDWLNLLAKGLAASIGAIGLNIVTGYAGQVSLGHAFFVAVGAYTAAAISGDPDGRTIGYGVTFLPVWLLAAGVVAAIAGVIVAPLAVRLRGLYLAIVTLGLVFMGAHVLKEWDDLTGGPGVGREAAVPELFGQRLNQPGDMFSADQKMYLLMLAMLVIFGVLARNIARSRVGRAFAAIRDRDVAAEVIGVSLTRYKLLAFGISSFYAGVAGALFYSITGFFEASEFSLLLSVQYIAMVLIGGVATISGSIMGALFITLLPRITSKLPSLMPFISRDTTDVINVFQVEAILYGLLIIGFLILEPRGLFGIWIRIRNYWKAWPFSY
jgi:branched-chain amino acid transport system permease protein